MDSPEKVLLSLSYWGLPQIGGVFAVILIFLIARSKGENNYLGKLKKHIYLTFFILFVGLIALGAIAESIKMGKCKANGYKIVDGHGKNQNYKCIRP